MVAPAAPGAALEPAVEKSVSRWVWEEASVLWVVTAWEMALLEMTLLEMTLLAMTPRRPSLGAGLTRAHSRMFPSITSQTARTVVIPQRSVAIGTDIIRLNRSPNSSPIEPPSAWPSDPINTEIKNPDVAASIARIPNEKNDALVTSAIAEEPSKRNVAMIAGRNPIPRAIPKIPSTRNIPGGRGAAEAERVAGERCRHKNRSQSDGEGEIARAPIFDAQDSGRVAVRSKSRPANSQIHLDWVDSAHRTLSFEWVIRIGHSKCGVRAEWEWMVGIGEVGFKRKFW